MTQNGKVVKGKTMIKKTLSKLALSLTLVLSMIGCGPEMPVGDSDGGVDNSWIVRPARIASLRDPYTFDIPIQFASLATSSQPGVARYTATFGIKQFSVGVPNSTETYCELQVDTAINSHVYGTGAGASFSPQGIRFTTRLAQPCPQLQPTNENLRAEIEGIGRPLTIVLIP